MGVSRRLAAIAACVSLLALWEAPGASGAPDWRRCLGENLAFGQGPLTTPATIVFAWMTSPEHRANILEPDFRDIGIAVGFGSPSPNGGDGVFYVAEFGRNLQSRR